ncbi:MAG: 50S ribosomal protein L24 [Sphingomonadales bacterium]
MANVKYKLKKGDKVIVLAGKDKGKRGEILEMQRGVGKAVVQGINLVKKHAKPSQVDPGGIREVEKAIQLSNLAIEDPKDGSATKIGYKFMEDGKKVRFARKSGEMIDG